MNLATGDIKLGDFADEREESGVFGRDKEGQMDSQPPQERTTMPEIKVSEVLITQIHQIVKPIRATLTSGPNFDGLDFTPVDSFDVVPGTWKKEVDQYRLEQWRVLSSYLTDFCNVDLQRVVTRKDYLGEMLQVKGDIQICESEGQSTFISSLPSGVLWQGELRLVDCCELKKISPKSAYQGGLVVMDCPQLKLPNKLWVDGDLIAGIENIDLNVCWPKAILNQTASPSEVQHFLASHLGWKVSGRVDLLGLDEVGKYYQALTLAADGNPISPAFTENLVKKIQTFLRPEEGVSREEEIKNSIFWSHFVIAIQRVVGDLELEISTRKKIYPHSYPGKSLEINIFRALIDKLSNFLSALPGDDREKILEWLTKAYERAV